MNLFKFIVLYFSLAIIGLAQTLKVFTKTTDYTLSTSDKDTIIVFTDVSKPLVRMIVPLETSSKTTFTTGSRIYGSSLTESTVYIVGMPGVEIISPEEAFRSKTFGSRWELVKINKNTWILQGDLYSLEMTAFVGDDVVVKAIVDTNATGPFTFMWYKNGVLIPNATNASLKLINVQLANTGKYYAIVSNTRGSFTSEATNLLVK